MRLGGARWSPACVGTGGGVWTPRRGSPATVQVRGTGDTGSTGNTAVKGDTGDNMGGERIQGARGIKD